MTAFTSAPANLAALNDAILSGLRLFTPPPDLKVSEWADRFARIPRESSAQHGRWITSTAEYQRGLMDAINDPAVERIVAIWCAQSGKSACLLNVMGYFAHQDPSPILMLQPTLEMSESFSKDRIAPMIRDTPSLTPLFGDPRSRDSGNTLLHKQFPGGHISLAGANSPASLASRPIRIVLCDEVDRYPASAGTEGDPVKLAAARATTFWNRKIILTSTPTVKGASRIETEFGKSDKRLYFVRCPQCNEQQSLRWENLKWPSPKSNPELKEHRPEECYYVCVNGCQINESDKPEMIRKGEWIPTAVSIDGRTAGFHLSALYSPWVSWPDLIRSFLDAKGKIEELKTFVNTKLAETFEVQGDRVERDVFDDRRHAYPAGCDAPDGVLLITAGVDVQKDRIEASAVGWGIDEESWALDHRVFYGDPEQKPVWDELDAWLQREFRHESGTMMRIRCTMIDSGYHTKQVYAFTRARQRRRIYASKGVATNSGQPRALLSRPTKANAQKALLFSIGTDTAKESFYGRLKVEAEGPGYCHFPEVEPRSEELPARFEWCDNEFFLQLSAEQLVTKYRAGVAYRQWVKRRERNEALDCRIGAMAALELLKPNFDMLRRRMALQAEPVMAPDAPAENAPEPPPAPAPAITAKYRVPRFNNPWVNSWRR